MEVSTMLTRAGFVLFWFCTDQEIRLRFYCLLHYATVRISVIGFPDGLYSLMSDMYSRISS